MTTIATRSDFDAFFESFFRRLNIAEGYRAYFFQHVDRLWLTSREFNLFTSRYDHVLEIGPGFAFLPFLWKECLAKNVSIYEGESYELLEFEKVYREHKIEAKYGDLFKVFGERDPARNVLPFPSDQFDSVICWETMEHFNFNPIPFVQELKRVTRKGGVLHITVPNQAKLDFRLDLLMGKSVRTPLEDYFLQMDDSNRMKYAPHWREYTLAEISELFRRLGFRIRKAGHLHTFMNRSNPSPLLTLKRSVVRLATALVPSFSTLCVIEAVKE